MPFTAVQLNSSVFCCRTIKKVNYATLLIVDKYG